MEKLLLALQFITRIPIKKELNYDQEILAASMAYYPLIGSLLGGSLAAVDYLLTGKLPPLVLNSLLLILLIVLTGGLHLDGLMDTADGLLGGKNTDEMLEIMRDSRVGAMGAVALFSCLLLKFSLLVEIGGEFRPYILVYFPTLSRWAMVYAVFNFPAARPEGLGWVYARRLTKKTFFLATIWTAGVGILLLGLIKGITAFVVSCLAVWIVASYINSVLGGLTGDNYGAINELMEALGLLVLLIFS